MTRSLTFEGLCSVVEKCFLQVIRGNRGVAEFAAHRAGFEGWMKAELCGAFAGMGHFTMPEENTTDLVVSGWRLELKTVPTNYSHTGAVIKTKNITNSVDAVIADIDKLNTVPHPNNAVLFVAYPLRHEQEEWQQIHLPKIAKKLGKLHYAEFTFWNSIPGVLYIGQPGETKTHCFDAP